MKPILLYLLQVIISSGLLYGYYHLFLRNKRFHQYNRYYLLAATVISILVPFLNIPVYFSQQDNSTAWLQTLSGFTVSDTNTVIVTGAKKTPVFSWQQALTILYVMAALFILVRFIIAIVRIRAMLRKYDVEQLGNIYFVNTDEPGTPFSFFRWMFWNNKITLQSNDGQQIFRHELFHIKQKHSWDIVFIELLTMIFWINPFFHIIKRELKAIHEFLADQFAIKENDQWNYAELLLMHLMGTPNLRLTQPFFHNQIKRRIAMITSSQKPKYQYFRKVLVLPLLALIAVLFAFTYKQKQEKKAEQQPVVNEPTLLDRIAMIRDGLTDTPGKKTKDEIITLISNSIMFKKAGNDGEKSKVELFIVDDKEYTPQEFEQKFNDIMFSGKVIVTPANNPDAMKKHGEAAKNGVIEIVRNVDDIEGFFKEKETTEPIKEVRMEEMAIFGNDPLYIIDGKIMPKGSDEIKKLDPNTIKTINVYKDKTAVDLYGKQGEHGVIQIVTKKMEELRLEEVREEEIKDQNDELKEVVVMGYPTRSGAQPQFPGGEEGWRKYLQANLKPNVPVDNGARPGSYSVSVQFEVDADGTVSGIRSLSKHGYGMEAEVERVIATGPKWIPATVSGKKIKAKKTQRITFIVADEEELKEVEVVGYPTRKTPLTVKEQDGTHEGVRLTLKPTTKEPLRINEPTNLKLTPTTKEANTSRVTDKTSFDVKNYEHISPIYPNPASTSVTIPYSTQVTGDGMINVIDASGKLAFTKKINLVKGLNTLTVDVSSLTRGTYFIVVNDGEKRATRVYKVAKD